MEKTHDPLHKKYLSCMIRRFFIFDNISDGSSLSHCSAHCLQGHNSFLYIWVFHNMVETILCNALINYLHFKRSVKIKLTNYIIYIQ